VPLLPTKFYCQQYSCTFIDVSLNSQSQNPKLGSLQKKQTKNKTKNKHMAAYRLLLFKGAGFVCLAVWR